MKLHKTMFRKAFQGVLLFAAVFAQPVFAQEAYTLEECKELALKNNAKIRSSQLAVESAKETRKEAFTNYFPQLSAMGVGFKSTEPMMQAEIPIGAFLGNPAMPPVDLRMMSKGSIGLLSASQPVFAGGQIYNGNKLAKVGEDVAKLQLQMSRDEVLLTVEQYFWQIVMLEEKMKTLGEAEKLLDRAHTDVVNAFQAGLVNKNDLLKVELRQNELQSGKLRVSNGLSMSRLVLAQFIGQTGDIRVSAVVSDTLKLAEKADHSSALKNRSEYRLLQKSVEASKLQTKMEIGKNLPTVALGAGWNAMSFDKGSAMASKQNFGMGFATVSVPISSWWGGSHAIKKKQLQEKTAENDKKNNEELLLIQMQQLWNEVNESAYVVTLTEKSIRTAEENVRLNSDYYKAGTGSITDLLDAQHALQDARDQHTEAFANYQMKLAAYRQATAGL